MLAIYSDHHTAYLRLSQDYGRTLGRPEICELEVVDPSGTPVSGVYEIAGKARARYAGNAFGAGSVAGTY